MNKGTLSGLDILGIGTKRYIDYHLGSLPGVSHILLCLKTGKRPEFNATDTSALTGAELEKATRDNNKKEEKREKHLEECQKCFSGIIRSLSPEALADLERDPKFDDVDNRSDPFDLLDLIMTRAKYFITASAASLIEEESKFRLIRQRPDEHTDTFIERWNAYRRHLGHFDPSRKPGTPSGDYAENRDCRALVEALHPGANEAFLQAHYNMLVAARRETRKRQLDGTPAPAATGRKQVQRPLRPRPRYNHKRNGHNTVAFVS